MKGGRYPVPRRIKQNALAESLSQKSFRAGIWSLAGKLASQAISFVIGIFLARILAPHEYGLIALAMVFIAISSVFVDGGFSTALIRKENPTQADLSTVFYLNVGAALLLFAVMFVTAPYMALYYGEPLLSPVVRLVSLQFLIASLCTVQSVLLTKKLDFRTQSIIHVAGVSVSGGVGLYMAFNGFGVMALVAQVLVQETVRALLLWVLGSWRPSWLFSVASFRELFSFGSRLLASGLLNKVFDNLYPLVIGRFFSVVQLSYYSRANGYQALFSQNFVSMVNAVSFPSLVKFQNDDERLRSGLQKMNTLVMLVNTPVML